MPPGIPDPRECEHSRISRLNPQSINCSSPIVSTDLSLNASPGEFEGNCLRFGNGNDVPRNRREIVFSLYRQSVKVDSADLRRQPNCGGASGGGGAGL